MKTKFRSIWIFLFCIGGILFMSECKKKEDSKTIRSPESVIEAGELQVTYSSPVGQTSEPHESDSIVVIFDHPMFPLSSFEEQPKSNILKISPEIPGTFHWLNPKTLAFSPKDRFPYSTDVKITIESGTRTFDGFVLKEDHQWSFSTVRPRLKQHFPQNKQEWIRLEEKILLIFNQPIQAAENIDFIQFVGLNKESNEL